MREVLKFMLETLAMDALAGVRITSEGRADADIFGSIAGVAAIARSCVDLLSKEIGVSKQFVCDEILLHGATITEEGEHNEQDGGDSASSRNGGISAGLPREDAGSAEHSGQEHGGIGE